MMDVVRYENALKQRFLSTIPLPESPAQAILNELSGPLPEVFGRHNEVYIILMKFIIILSIAHPFCRSL